MNYMILILLAIYILIEVGRRGFVASERVQSTHL